MSKVTGGKAVVDTLLAEEVDHVFGLIGSAGMEIFDALHGADDIRFIGVRDERTGTHMADGYARASGKAGVVIAGQNGPGVTNLVTGLAQASAAYSPVVALAGSLSSGHVYRDAFQEVDQQSLLKTVTKKTWTATQAKRLPEMTHEAFRTALAPRRGPVALNLPRDLLAEIIEYDHGPSHWHGASAPAADGDSVAQAASLLRAAQRPLILAGGGVKNGRCHEAVLKLAELLHAPVVMSPGHGDALPCAHPLYAGQMGPRGNVVATDLARQADVILALGTRIGFNTTFYSFDNLNAQAAIIQVETDPLALGRLVPVALGIFADASIVAAQLARELSGHAPTHAVQWVADFQSKRSALLAQRDAEGARASNPIQPATLFKMLRDGCPDDTMFTMDAGTLCLQATDQLNFAKPPSLFTPLDFGLVGFSYACGLGVKLACPERTVISLMGDGGFGMTMSEIGTAVSHRINSICVVMNNGCWGAEKAYQRDFFGGRYIGADVPNPPYDKLAELFGAAGFRVERAEQFGPALQAALACGKPAVIDVQVDPNALYSFRRDSFAHRAQASK
ncbi:thiamine pyrophosphate-binding protein [Pandoraea sp.]|uniref:thiamine pyrophosphate-binding protein n=1 Tax=Pandoraea sp. TaxID=1883445 RepID=UPI00121A364F|nr:thiamine pyrophosphate-binding protein [Pandoraea sp.]TAL56444.1 MAG: thiamine pyrophosphate-binding protein [Pandoraea sp.]TAM15263.1 MAG: thiamine pyrophosphate-binding protein [Pandoraea sp.]